MIDAQQLLASYGPLVLINLPARRDRRAEFEDQLSSIGLSYSDPQVQIFPAIRPTSLEGFPTLGTRGCFLSHLRVLEQAVEANATSVIICEDDLDFAPGFLERLPAVLAELEQTEWDLFYAGYSSDYNGDPIGESANIFRVPADVHIMCTHLYLIKGPAMQDLVNYLHEILKRPAGHPDGGPMHYDGALNHYRKDRPNLVTLATLPTLGIQRASRTDIHDLRWFDKTPVVRDLVQLMRKVIR